MASSKRALLVGINHYDRFPELNGCVADAEAMAELLRTNEDGSRNYSCQLLTSEPGSTITRRALRRKWLELFDSFRGDALFYFSGHGIPTHVGGALVTQDGEREDPGLFMSELMTLANSSQAESVLLILDCCYSGAIGDLHKAEGTFTSYAQIREGVTILAASQSGQKAMEEDGHGIFTQLLLGALRGGAADLKGHVSAASVYAYAEQILGDWQQRPLYKSHASSLSPIRTCNPMIELSLLRRLPELFPEPDGTVRLDPSFEFSSEQAQPLNVEKFNHFKKLRNATLLQTEGGEDLFYIALLSKKVRLTPLGRFYWELAKRQRI